MSTYLEATCDSFFERFNFPVKESSSQAIDAGLVTIAINANLQDRVRRQMVEVLLHYGAQPQRYYYSSLPHGGMDP